MSPLFWFNATCNVRSAAAAGTSKAEFCDQYLLCIDRYNNASAMKANDGPQTL